MRYISATQIFSGKEFFDKNTVLVIDDTKTITDIISGDSIEPSKIETYEGIITPGFVNAHCHLELSHLKNKIKQNTGIVDFGLGIIKHRNELEEEIQLECMGKADKIMQEQGIVAVGDISNTTLSVNVKKKSKLYYHTFVELISLNPDRAEDVFEAGKKLLTNFSYNGLSASLAPHAPYSASLPLIVLCSDYCYKANKPTSIHNQESVAENEFFQSKTGDYLRLYEQLNIPIDYFKAVQQTSLQTIITDLNADVNTLLVHNTFTNKHDIEFAKLLHHNLFWCLCPNANLYIENTLPNINLLIKENCNLTIGTDSLASNSNLSIVDEINTIIKSFPTVKLEHLLRAATFNGAKFLGIENDFGLIERNKNPGINLIQKVKENYTVKILVDING